MAALDMALHGARFILIEFAAGVLLCGVIGALSLVAGIRSIPQGIGWQLILGAELLCVALNYLPLLLHAIDLASNHHPREESADELANPRRVRRYGLLQLWILVPFAVVWFALRRQGQALG